MHLPHKLILALAVSFCFFSCKEAIGDQHRSNAPKEKNPATEQKQMKKVNPDGNPDRPIEPDGQELKKEKTKVSDTLKPLVAVS